MADSPVVDLSSLAGLTNLTSLCVTGTRADNLAPLAGLTNLTHLTLQGEYLKNGDQPSEPFDLESLTGIRKLVYLELTDCVVNVLAVLNQKENLSELSLTDVKHEDRYALLKSSNINCIGMSISND